MSDEKNPSGTATTPEAEASARIAQLQAQVKLLEQEIKTFEGRARNRDPRVAHRLKAENAVLRSKLVSLEKALFAIINDAFQPRQPADAELQREILVKAAVEFFKQTNLDPELWKSIVS